MSGKSVLLISANTELTPAPVYPLALPRLASALRRAGHTVRQFDVLVHGLDSLPGALKQLPPHLIAVSLRNIDNTDAYKPRLYVDDYRQLIKLIRASSSAPVVIGGSAFSLFPGRLMNALGADFGIVGPGEETLCRLLDAVDSSKLDKIPNLFTTDSAPASFASSSPAMTDLHHAPDILDYYWRNGGMIGLQTKRGCPNNCSYCTYPLIDGSVVQWAEPGRVVDEIEKLLVDKGVDYFFIVDSLFNVSAEQEQLFAEEISRRSLKISWGAFFSPSAMDRRYIGILKQSGLKHVEFGTDSLCDAMLDSFRKNFSVADVLRTSELCTEMGLFVAHYLIFGGPGETADTISRTLQNTGRLDKCFFFPFPGVRIYPRTAICDTAVAQGVISSDDDCLEPKFYFAKPFTHSTIWQYIENHLDDSRRWFLPGKTDMINRSLGRLRAKGKKGPLWEYMLV